MERRQLAYLVAIADTGSFTAAAERLHVAQPGLSAQVAKLERELGERLLDRDSRGVRPTAVGEQVLARAREVLAAFEEVRRAAAEARGLLTGSVVLGTVRGVPLGEVATRLAAFRDRHPGVALGLVEAESDALVEALVGAQTAAGAVDLARLGVAGDDPPGLECRLLREDRLVVAVGDDDAWAGRRRLGLRDLADRPLVALTVGSGQRTALEEAARAAGVAISVPYEAGTVAAVVELVSAGLGPGVLPAGALGPDAPGAGLVGVPLVPAVTSRLTWARPDPVRRTPSPAARALWEALDPTLR